MAGCNQIMNHCDEIVGRENRRVAGGNQIMNHCDEIVGI